MFKRNREYQTPEEENKRQHARLSKKDFQVIKRIIKYVGPNKGLFFIGLLFLVGSTAASLVFPYIFGSLIDIVDGQEKLGLETVDDAALLLFGVLLIQAFFSYFRILIFTKVSERSMANIRKDLYKHMLFLHVEFFEKNRIGELTSRFTADIGMLRDTLSTTSAEFLRQFATLIIGVSLLFIFSLKLTLFMLLTFPVLVILALVFGKHIKKLSKRTQSYLADSNIIAEETFQSISMVKSFTNEEKEIKRYNNSINEMVKVAINTAHFRGAFASFIIAALFGGIIGVLWYGANLVQADMMSIGELVTYLFYTIYIGASVGGMGDMFGQIQKAAGASERVLEILDEISEEQAYKSSSVIFQKGDIEFEDVEFEYPSRPETKVIQGVSLKIKEGQSIALVGQSGGGKSTITHLISRFYNIRKGRISINGIDINDVDINSLRGQIGIVPQDVILFGGSIRENILYGNINASENEIIEAAKKANAWDFISKFSEGLNTNVGDRGIQLSGGQKQRIAIARTILKDPAILILDEATSSLDAEAERLVQEAINNLMNGRTTIMIAHRLSSVKKADQIFVIENGKITEHGLHDELIASDGSYKRLVQLQFHEELG